MVLPVLLLVIDDVEIRKIFEFSLRHASIVDASDVACMLSCKSDARDTAIELFGADPDEKVITYLVQLWKAPAKSQLARKARSIPLVEKATVASGSSCCVVKATGAPPLPILCKAADVLLLRTTVAVLSGPSTLVLLLWHLLQNLPCLQRPTWRRNGKSFWKSASPFKNCRGLSPRFVVLFGLDGARVPPLAQSDIFKNGSSAPPTIVGYLKETKGLVA